MIDKTTAKILKFVKKNQPCTFEDIETFLKVDYHDSPHLSYINKNRFICRTDSLPDGRPLLALTPKGESAIQEYKRLVFAETKSSIAIVIAFIALLKPSSIDLVEFMKRLVLSLLK